MLLSLLSLLANPALAVDLDLSRVIRDDFEAQHGFWPQAHAVTLRGDYAYVAESDFGLLMTVDVSNSTNLHALGFVATTGHATDIALSGNHAFLAVNTGVDVFNIANPTNPVLVSTFSRTNVFASRLALSGHHAYLAGGFGMHIIDISNPTNLQWVSSYTPSNSFRVTAVTVSGQHAFVGLGLETGDALHVINIANPANPQLIGTYQHTNANGFEKMTIAGNHLYLAAGGSGLAVFDISNLANPHPVGWNTAGYYARDVIVLGQRAYVARGFELVVYGIENPATPEYLATRNFYVTDAMGLAGDSNRIYVAASNFFPPAGNAPAGLYRVEVRAANPQSVARLNPSGQCCGTALAVSGNHVYVVDRFSGFSIVDITTPSLPQVLGSYSHGPIETDLTVGIAVLDHYAYLASATNGLQVVDIGNPANPQRVGGIDTAGYSVGVTLSGGHAFVADGLAGLDIIDVGNPVSLQRVGRYTNSGVSAVVLDGPRAYLAAYSNGLEVIDISNPADPQRLGGLPIGGAALGIATAGQRAYLAAGRAGLLIIDVSNPTNPLPIGAWRLDEDAESVLDVALLGNAAYVADPRHGLHVIDVSNPTRPRRVGGNSYLAGLDVAVTSQNVFVATYGLAILDLFRPVRLQALPVTEPGLFRFEVEGPRNVPLAIQRSQNLANWQDWTRATPAAGPVELIDSALGPNQIYRAYEVP